MWWRWASWCSVLFYAQEAASVNEYLAEEWHKVSACEASPGSAIVDTEITVPGLMSEKVTTREKFVGEIINPLCDYNGTLIGIRIYCVGETRASNILGDRFKQEKNYIDCTFSDQLTLFVVPAAIRQYYPWENCSENKGFRNGRILGVDQYCSSGGIRHFVQHTIDVEFTLH